PLRNMVLLLAFSSQMFYATAARVSNDWLAVPLASWLMVAGIRVCRRPGFASAVWFATFLTLGLLTKAYFLAFVPLFLIINLLEWARRRLRSPAVVTSILIAGLLAAPWYARNIKLYHSITAVPEAIS